ncbi:GntR family transcriptional regulator [Ktedonospora formicarum]|uniref:HTH gntR-type domain-containing protein n=1 Tax=Ktedonospora formicarum TaxID=2778364 RepID=A0A8J3I4G2_9CHLR|nr:GntR family transcriptional regulator [Ktedonospora formicarum]GHO46012.1 hypothetical protein KSX_41750 [Ktedonospora formicarum]
MTLKLNKHENATALHRQLLTYFRERILDGRLPEGTRLPTELELATEHQISRDTIRHALGQLVEEGLLERVPGRGTFVRRSTVPSPPVEIIPTQDKRIGIVLNRPTGAQLNMDILIAVEQAVKMGGYHASFTYAEENQVQFARDIKRLRADHVQGLIVFPICDTSYEETIWQLQAEHFPLVLIDRYYPALETDYVGSDNVGGGFRATEHLLILGHHRIGFCHSPIETIQTTSVRDRWEGYCKALQEYGIPYDESLVVPNKQVPKNEIIDLYEALLRRPDRPTAIFAANDLAALDVLTAAQNCGLRVPDDLALVGFDDLDFAPRVHPPLTTVNQPLADIGLYAGKLLINRIEGQAGPPKHIELPTRLIVRSSCGARLRVKKATATLDPS